MNTPQHRGCNDPEQEALRRETLELIESLPAAYLSTVDEEGYPQTRAVFNLRCRWRFPDLTSFFEGAPPFLLYFTTNTSSRKMEEIRRLPRACAYFCRQEDSSGVLVTGTVEAVNDLEVKQAIWQEGWERYYALGRGDPEYAVLRFIPCRAKGWRHGAPFAFDLH